jgi:nucleoside-diphosphate-sugar epimerase
MTRTVCVAGASGLVGANIVREALARGYAVRGSLRDSSDPAKAPYLKALPGAEERLTLFDADMTEPGSFDTAMQGCDAVFIACLIPMYFGPSGVKATDMDDAQGYAEIIMPTVNGCLNILGSAIKAGTNNALICSSTSSTNPIPPVEFKNEVDHWSDPDQQCADKKYTSATKAVMEKAAMALCRESGIRLSIFLPTLMLGPMILPDHADEGFMAVLARMVKGEKGRHDKVPNSSTSMAHIHDVANLFLAAYENPNAEGRYFGMKESWHWQDLYAELEKLIPGMVSPEALDVEPEAATTFDFTRRDSLSVQMRTVPEVLAAAVAFARNPTYGA